MTSLTEKKCQVCESGGVPALSQQAAEKLLQSVSADWKINGDKITRIFEFKGFYKTMAFVNAVAWIVNNEGHHPDLEVSFNKCTVNFTTHAVNGLTENDFICAAKVDALLN
jgi:4a-hydroxytetrahydrobiopterin dehydratase